MNQCKTEYPVDVERARKAFTRGVNEIENVYAQFGAEFKAYDNQNDELYFRRSANHNTRMDNAMAARHWDFFDPFPRPSKRIDSWFKSLEWKFARLKILSDRALSLTLTRDEIEYMAHAETKDFFGEAMGVVEKMRANPIPELPPLIEKIERPKPEETKPAQRPSIWDSFKKV